MSDGDFVMSYDVDPMTTRNPTTRTRKRCTPQLIAGLALLGMFAAGCATASRQQPVPSQPGQALMAARGKTLGARTARFRSTVTVGAHETIRIDGVIDFARSVSQVTETMPGLPGATTTIYLADVTYTKDPRNTPKGAKPWLKVKIGPAAKQSDMLPFGVADPRRALDFLYGVSDVTDLGTQVVRGTPTRHWRATVTLADMVAAQFHEQRAKVVAELDAEGLGAEAATPVQVDLWVDGQGRVRKVVNASPSTSADRQGRWTITIEYFDFGAPIRIVLPPASQVAGDHY